MRVILAECSQSPVIYSPEAPKREKLFTVKVYFCTGSIIKWYVFARTVVVDHQIIPMTTIVPDHSTQFLHTATKFLIYFYMDLHLFLKTIFLRTLIFQPTENDKIPSDESTFLKRIEQTVSSIFMKRLSLQNYFRDVFFNNSKKTCSTKRREMVELCSLRDPWS